MCRLDTGKDNISSQKFKKKKEKEKRKAMLPSACAT